MAITLIKGNGGEAVKDKKKEQSTDQPTSTDNETADARAITKVEPKQMTVREAADLINAKINTQKPSAKDTEQLRAAIKLLPDIANQIGDVALQAREQMIKQVSANAIVHEAIRQRVENLQAELGYDESPAIEKLLIEQVGLCWLHMYGTQQQYTNARATASMSIDQAAWLEKRLTITQNRYLKAIETLAKVRKLAKNSPAQMVMMNIARQQINAAIGS
jgi:aminopeptidase N